MSYSSRYYKPALRSSVDVQLQTAFSDSNWATVVRLAELRFKSLKDPYYEAIKYCAQSQLDTANATFVALGAIQDLAQSKSVTDADVLDLYEWAILDIRPFSPAQYAESLGTLRVRWVKANPKHPAAVQCLEACVRRWDLVSAQQIAVALDKAHITSGDRRFMFWSITLTYLLAKSEQVPESSHKLYSLLALKQLQRAAEITETTDSSESPSRGLQTEEEILLYYKVLLKYGSKQDVVSLINSPKLGALQQLKQGRQHLFNQAIRALEGLNCPQETFSLCLGALEIADQNGSSSALASDWTFWKSFLVSSRAMKDGFVMTDSTMSQYAYSPEAIARSFSLSKSNLDHLFFGKLSLNAMQQKNFNLIQLDKAFWNPDDQGSQPSEDKELSSKVDGIVSFCAQQKLTSSVFDDIKGYLDLLNTADRVQLLEKGFQKLGAKFSTNAESTALKILEYKIRYFVATAETSFSHFSTLGQDADSPETLFRCQLCSTENRGPWCTSCLESVVKNAAATYNDILDDEETLSSFRRLGYQDPRRDLAVTIAVALLQRAGLANRKLHNEFQPSLQMVQRSLLLQGTLVLDTQLKINTGDISIRLLLVQLYLLLGCASLAYETWQPLGIKRSIQDSLSPLLFDRISTVSPGLFLGSQPLMEPLRSYYMTVSKENAPSKVWDAFSTGNYNSIVDIEAYDFALRRSCTMVMTAVEERRGTRLLGGKIEDGLKDAAMLRDIKSDTKLVNVTDYGSFPHLESVHGVAIQDLVRLGPELSNDRCRLSLLVEEYLDLVTIKLPKEFKPLRPGEVAPRYSAYLKETLSRLQPGLLEISRTSEDKLTASEREYFTLVAFLVSFLRTAVDAPPSGPAPGLSEVAASVKGCLAELRDILDDAAEDPSTLLSSMHALSAYRDGALAIKRTALFALAHQERQLAWDRTGKTALHKDVLAHLKALDALATAALAAIRKWIQSLKEKLSEGGWLDRLLEWTFDEPSDQGEGGGPNATGRAVEELVGGRAGAEYWAARVTESWRDGVRGWAAIKWE